MRAACVGLCDADSDESKQVAWVGVSIYFERFHSPRIFEFLLKKGKKSENIEITEIRHQHRRRKNHQSESSRFSRGKKINSNRRSDEQRQFMCFRHSRAESLLATLKGISFALHSLQHFTSSRKHVLTNDVQLKFLFFQIMREIKKICN